MIALAHAAATWFMASVIWIMQVVHYPSLENSTPESFARNTKRTALVVVPVMLIEAIAAAALLVVPSAAALLGAALLALIWASTLFIQFPLHRALSAHYSDQDYARLLRTNWIRVAAWSARAVIALALVRRGS